MKGIEPSYSAWKAAALPLSYTRKLRGQARAVFWWRGLDSNQRRLSQRIYSPSPLTTRAPLRNSPPTRLLEKRRTETPRRRAGIPVAGVMVTSPLGVNLKSAPKIATLRPPFWSDERRLAWIAGAKLPKPGARDKYPQFRNRP